MKKSEIYSLLQKVVIEATQLDVEQKTECLKELFDKESMALFRESQEVSGNE